MENAHLSISQHCLYIYTVGETLKLIFRLTLQYLSVYHSAFNFVVKGNRYEATRSIWRHRHPSNPPKTKKKKKKTSRTRLLFMFFVDGSNWYWKRFKLGISCFISFSFPFARTSLLEENIILFWKNQPIIALRNDIMSVMPNHKSENKFRKLLSVDGSLFK